MQSPSFLEYQRQLNQRQGHDNAQTLFSVEPSPCDNQIRKLLDPIAPRYFNPVFFEVFAHLEQQHLLDRSEEHTSELQSLAYLVCRLLLEKKKNSSTNDHLPYTSTTHSELYSMRT